MRPKGPRMSPRRPLSAYRMVPYILVVAFLSIWAVAYFAISPTITTTTSSARSTEAVEVSRLRSHVSPGRVQAEVHRYDRGGGPEASQETSPSDAGGAVSDGRDKETTRETAFRDERYPRAEASATANPHGVVARKTTVRDPPKPAAPAPDLEPTIVGGGSSSGTTLYSVAQEPNHWTTLPLNETANLYKSLKYSDLVIPRWFDLDYEKENSHDSIEVLGGDKLGDLTLVDLEKKKEESASIPRILHFTWKTDKLEELPELFRLIQLKWRQLNPDWEIKIWTDEECEKLIKDHYPEYYFFYSDFEVTAERSDIFRYLVLDTYGGYYADMDIEPLQPLDGLIEVVKHPDCVIGLEPEVHAILAYNKYHMIGNAFMGSIPGHTLWKWLIPQTIKRYYADRSQKQDKDATKITGPIAVDNVIQRNPEITRTCALLRPDVTAPAYDLNQAPYSRCQDILKKHQLKLGRNDKDENPYTRICKEVNLVGDVNKDYPRESFMVHHWAHTWRAAPDDDQQTKEGDKNGGNGAKDKKEEKGEPAKKQEPKIHASTNIGKEVVLFQE